jgi:hypothetical protein
MLARRRIEAGERWRAMRLVVICLLAGGCDEIIEPAHGTLQIDVAIAGVDFPSSFSLTLNGEPLAPVAPGKPVISAPLPAGSHEIHAPALPVNCSVEGPNPRLVSVVGDAVTPVSIPITCLAVFGAMEVRIATEGLDAPNAYFLVIGNRSPVSRPPQGSTVVTELPGGAHVVNLGVTPNCTVSGDNPRVVGVATGGISRDTARTTFTIACRLITGVLEATLTASGEDVDHSGITLRAGSHHVKVENLPEIVRVIVPTGQQQVVLGDVASNCVVEGQNPRVLNVTAGAQTRDTVRTAFHLKCVATEKIVFVREEGGTSWITVAHADGSNAVRLTQGWSPSWSRRRNQVLYTAVDCSYAWYYYGCITLGLHAVTADGVGRGTSSVLTENLRDESGRWSPDDSTLAVVRNGSLILLKSNVSEPTTLVAQHALPSLDRVHDAAWSPDGRRLAFVCVFTVPGGYWYDICVVNQDGSGLLRLTTDSGYDGKPSWSPDGSVILFESARQTANGTTRIALMKPDGSGFEPLFVGSAPALSRDGSRILFVRDGLFIANRDGTGVTRLTTANDYSPNWRP